MHGRLVRSIGVGESRAARSAMIDADAAARNGKIRDAYARYELIVKQYPGSRRA
jgi:hypothetical protein